MTISVGRLFLPADMEVIVMSDAHSAVQTAIDSFIGDVTSMSIVVSL